MTHIPTVGTKTVEVKCQRCRRGFKARVADRKRGWGKFCSKSCKAIKQTQTFAAGKKPTNYKRHDGISEMRHKLCDTCGDPAINGVYLPDGDVGWGCRLHHDTSHPMSSDALGQW